MCVDSTTGKAEGFGELKGGLAVECSLQLCRKYVKVSSSTNNRLLSPKYPLLPSLAAKIPFETAIGLNGRVWFKTASVDQTIALRRILEMVDSGELSVDKAAIDKALKKLLA